LSSGASELAAQQDDDEKRELVGAADLASMHAIRSSRPSRICGSH
jgi:hypothetical protein